MEADLTDTTERADLEGVDEHWEPLPSDESEFDDEDEG